MSQQEPVQVWVVAPDGRFVEQSEPRCCPCEMCEDDCEDDESEVNMIFANDPQSICPCCQQPIRRGEVTVTLMHWGEMYDGQDDEFPLYGTPRLIHLTCLKVVMGEGDETP
jgi:hypothetical protein